LFLPEKVILGSIFENLYNEPTENARIRFISRVCARGGWLGFVTMKKLPSSWVIDHRDQE
jgi:hypothetical protein